MFSDRASDYCSPACAQNHYANFEKYVNGI